MKKNQTIIGFVSLALVSGCQSLMPKTNVPAIPSGRPYTPPDLELTLIQKEMPTRDIDYFSRAELFFSTNKTQETHATLTRQLTVELADKLKAIPFGTTMKESEWDRVLINKQKMENGFMMRVGNWQRFY